MKKFLLVIIGLVFGLISCDSSVNIKSGASIISEDFVKERLNYPTTTDFDRDVVWTPDYLDENRGTLLKKFTAKNAFGVSMDYVYKIDIRFLGGEWTDANNWTYDYLIIEEVPSGKQYYYTPNR